MTGTWRSDEGEDIYPAHVPNSDDSPTSTARAKKIDRRRTSTCRTTARSGPLVAVRELVVGSVTISTLASQAPDGAVGVIL